MNSILLASAMICSMSRMADNSCQQCCESGVITVCKYIERCPKTEEEKRIEVQQKLDSQYLQLQIIQEENKQLEILNKQNLDNTSN